MTAKIAFLACSTTLPGSPDRRTDAFEHDYQIAALRDGLAQCGAQGLAAEVVDIDWRAPLEQLRGFDLALLGTAWDYTEHKAEFLERLAALEAAGVIVCNPAEVVRWNADKLYLQELEQRGAPSIPTLWPDNPNAADIVQAFDHFGCERLVVKRRVGAGAIGQDSFTRSTPPPADWQLGQAGMIQPFLPAIAEEGEHSFIFVDGAFSHALIKQAVPGEYRIQSLYGGIEVPVAARPDDIAAAAAIMALLPFAQPSLYARIDMVRLPSGQLAVIEAELIEPYLYPLADADFGARLARAVLARLAA